VIVFEFLPSNNRPVYSFLFGFYPYKIRVVHKTMNVKWTTSYFSHFLETSMLNILQGNSICVLFVIFMLFLPNTKYRIF